ncbi:hypothetical protein STRIP9103_05596 [Streptomyces ipomoeae 91-03]|uniref:Uncharacterized protein n=1 Tax=Streptomyces ipomoeae 91-03 TaxID=698759 RepID=L1KL28_9ACTN|nr:hypothetical protein STRIP9103_05596 [Streptomyces ipomoeae 91-03]
MPRPAGVRRRRGRLTAARVSRRTIRPRAQPDGIAVALDGPYLPQIFRYASR